MAIADRPIQGGNGGGIAPYLAAGTSRVGRAPWEDELNKLLLGIPQSEWGSIRAGLGLSPGGGYAPGGVQAGTAAPATMAQAAPSLMVGAVPAGGAVSGAPGEGQGGAGAEMAGNVADFGGMVGSGTPGYGVSHSLADWGLSVLGNLGPLGMAATLGTMVADPDRTTPYGVGDVFGGGGSGQGSTDSSGQYGGPAGGADTANSANSAGGPSAHGGGTDPNGNEWRKGGYTGAGRDGVVQPGRQAGTVHEGELVLNANAVRSLPPELLALLGHFNAAGR